MVNVETDVVLVLDLEGVVGGDVLLIVLLASIDEVAIAANVLERQF